MALIILATTIIQPKPIITEYKSHEKDITDIDSW